MLIKKGGKKKRSNPDVAAIPEWSEDFDPGAYLHNLLNDVDLTDNEAEFLLEQERREFPRAANIMEFTYSSSYLNFPLYPRQLQIAGHLLGEICPYCSDKDFMYQMFDQSIGEINDRVMFTQYGQCPKCKRTKIDFIKADKFHLPQALIGIIGQRSGKNYLLSALANYQLHRFQTLEIDGKRVSPQKYFNRGPGMLTMTFTAYTLGQAMKNIWGVFKPMYMGSQWFKEYGKFLKYHGKRMGEELYANNSTYLRFMNKSIDVACAAPNQSTLRGPTRFFFGIDEVCWHNVRIEESGKKSSSVLGTIDEIWNPLNNSLKSIRQAADKNILKGFFDTPTGLDVCISSPVHANDFGMRRLRISDQDRRVFGSHYATWEFCPDYTSRNDFASEYIANPINAERDFGAIPPLTMSPWIADPKPILVCSRTKVDSPVITYDLKTERSMFGENVAWYELKDVKDSANPKVISIDNGYNNNAFALTISCLGSNGKPRVDQCVVLSPSESYNINLSKMWELFVYPLCKRMNAALILYDRWNSLQNVQKLQDEGQDARQYSLTPKDFQELRLKLMSGEVSYPFSEYDPSVFLDSNKMADVDLVQVSKTKPGFALLLQTLTVRTMGPRVVKPLAGDDDVFRTAALGLRFLFDPEMAPMFQTAREIQAGKSTRSLGYVKMGSASASATTNLKQRLNANGKPRALGTVKASMRR